MPLQIRRGTTAERLTITPLPGELIYDTTTEQIFVGDGTSIGGRITTGISIEDASDAAAALFTSGAHTGITFTFDDANNQINSSVSFNTLLENLNLNEFDIVGTGNINIDGQITADVNGNLTGNLTGDVNGSVFANDSTLLVDGVAGQIVGDINAKLAGDLNVNGQRIVGSTVEIAPTDITVIGSTVLNRSGNLYITRNNFSSLPGQGFTFAQHHNIADAVNFVYYRTRGSSTSPAALQIGDRIVDIVFVGHDGTIPIPGAALTAFVEGAVSSGALPTNLSFSTHNGTILSIRAELSSQGVWKVNTIQGLTDTLSITGNLSGDVKGSVYSDDSTRILDGTSGRITAPSATLAEFLKLPVYADDTARNTAILVPEKGMVIFIEAGTLPAATNQMQIHNGTNWISL
jgi:hypothetical protein